MAEADAPRRSPPRSRREEAGQAAALAAQRPSRRRAIYFDALTARDADAMAAHFQPGRHRGHRARSACSAAPTRSREFFGGLFAALPDAEMTVERIVADHEVAAVQWRMRAPSPARRSRASSPPASGVELRGFDVLEIDEDGKITRNTAYSDGAAFARAIGLLPPQDAGPSKAMLDGFNTVTKAAQGRMALAMIVLVTFTVGLVIWIVAWAFGIKAFDAFLFTLDHHRDGRGRADRQAYVRARLERSRPAPGSR